jgi:hypothetical protein
MRNVPTPATAMMTNTMMNTATMATISSDESVLAVSEIRTVVGTVADGDGDSVDDGVEGVTELLVVADLGISEIEPILGTVADGDDDLVDDVVEGVTCD